MFFASLLATSLNIVFRIWIRFVSLWFRPPGPLDRNRTEAAQGEGNIKASASVSSSDPLVLFDVDSSESEVESYRDVPASPDTLDTPDLSPESTPELVYPITTPQHLRFERTGRSCNIFSPPTTRKQFPASGYADVSRATPSMLNIPDMSMLTSQEPPLLIFDFDDDDGSVLDLEGGLGVRLVDTTSRHSSMYLGSSASIFTKLAVDMLSPSRPITPATVPPVSQPTSPGQAQNLLPMFIQDLGQCRQNGDSPSYGIDAASYAATYSGSPEADIRLEAFHLYEFTPYTPPMVSNSLGQQSSVANPSTPLPSLLCYHASGELSAAISSPQNNVEMPSVARRADTAGLRPLVLPKELATRQVIQVRKAPPRTAFFPRPLLLSGQATRTVQHTEAALVDVVSNTDAISAFTDELLLPDESGKDKLGCSSDAGSTASLQSDVELLIWDTPASCTAIHPGFDCMATEAIISA
ncbi:hypothetical protein BXZ70DRAFT_935870 [Cristinia sonorae]|uniref:Uncharacterized protein n=1 Tax=Cristinia sonorae TaxID=1940300 RepID=A0A8K0UPN0_9AGAR|nr:hypothetical protein BXZ70DRAFT_935870 [Cristinia sonorae]